MNGTRRAVASIKLRGGFSPSTEARGFIGGSNTSPSSLFNRGGAASGALN
jgi:hypothetical protein